MELSTLNQGLIFEGKFHTLNVIFPEDISPLLLYLNHKQRHEKVKEISKTKILVPHDIDAIFLLISLHQFTITRNFKIMKMFWVLIFWF